MCLLFVASRVIPGCPLFFFMNREESWARPTDLPRLNEQSGGATWLGGVDRLAGGTWLGVNQHGLTVALANRPKPSVAASLASGNRDAFAEQEAEPAAAGRNRHRRSPSSPRSRGLLCRDLLARATIGDAVDEVRRQSEAFEFAGFNVFLFDRDAALLVESGDKLRIAELKPGTHALTNGRLDDVSDARIARVLDEYAESIQTAEGLTAKIGAAQKICGLKADGGRVGLCLHAADRGTVSSTIIALTADPARTQYHYAPGPPCVTPYTDYSPTLRQLLTGAVP